MRIHWADELKGVCILLVVLFHMGLYFGSIDGTPAVISLLNEALYTVRMPLFFFLSGLLSRSLVSRSWREVMTKRVWPLVWLFLVWTTIRWFYFGLVENAVNPEEGDSIWQIPLSLIFPNTGLWFLWALAAYTIASKFLFRFGWKIALGVSLLVSFMSYSSILHFDTYAHDITIRLFAFFVIGVVFAQGVLRIPAHPSLWLIACLGIGALLANIAILTKFDLPIPLWVTALRIGSALSGAAFMVLLFSRMGSAPVAGRLLAYLGERTPFIYLAHILIIAGMVEYLRAIDASGVVVSLAFWRVTLPLSIGVALAVARLAMASSKSAWLYRPPSALRTRSVPSRGVISEV